MTATKSNLISTSPIADTYALPVPAGREVVVSVPPGTRVEFASVPAARTVA